MRTRSLGITAGVAVALLVSAGCSSSGGKSSTSNVAGKASTGAPAATSAASSSSSAGGGGLIGVDYPRSDTDFWNSYISYVPKFASSLGVTIKTTNSQNDVQKLIANTQALLGEGAKAIVMAPQDTAAIGPELGTLSGKHIPVVTIDTRPDTGNVYMVVRADNKAYGTKACLFLGNSMKGTGSVVMLEGDTASINGRDRTDAFNSCMKSKYPKITVHGEPSKWDGPTAASQLQTALTQDKNIRGIYMESSFALAGTIQVLKQAGLTAKAGDPKHVFIVSNDGIPQELADIRSGVIDATVSQPADLYAKYGLYYAQAALQGKTFQPGPTDHQSTIIQVRPGVLEDQLSAPLVTRANVDDMSLWGNNLK
jgi:simple sugar transport system substrate-binding protein/ribose transport system substrate-binding protein